MATEPELQQLPSLPPGIPPADPNAPKRGLTQEQIDALAAGIFSIFPALKEYWPLILAVGSVIAGLGWFTGRTTSGPSPDTVVMLGKLDAIIEKAEKISPCHCPPVKPDVKPDVKPAPEDTTKKITYALTTETSPAILQNLPPGAIEVHPPGTGYSFNGITYIMPVAITRNPAGTIIEVRKLP